ncbi:MAG: hypothetical protein NXH95_03690 [Pseudomonadaceae bacterium]|nr:hypothetical protein [Pseudomonadaceae bacterium]
MIYLVGQSEKLAIAGHRWPSQFVSGALQLSVFALVVLGRLSMLQAAATSLLMVVGVFILVQSVPGILMSSK